MSIKIGSTDITDIKIGSTNINYVYSGSTLVWQRGTPPTPTENFYLTSDVNFYAMYTIRSLTVSIDYRIGETGSWTSWDGSQVSVSGGTKLYVRNNNTTLSTSFSNYFKFSGNFKTVGGNLKYMLGESDTLSNHCFYYLFKQITSLQNASELILPWMTLADYCYTSMFSGCTSLETCPALPATTLAYVCYNTMFSGCTSLIQLPALPATTLAGSCYMQMFYDCSNIKLSTTQEGEYVNAYRIPTTGEGTTASGALAEMFNSTGGTFTGTPSINTTYYTSNEIIS